MGRLFISHSSKDDDFVRRLREALADHGGDGWIDSRELRGGDPLWEEIQKAIEGASAYAVVVPPDGLQSKWVGKELRHALKVGDERGKDKYPVIPLSLNGTELGVLEEFFGEEPLYSFVSSGAGGIRYADLLKWCHLLQDIATPIVRLCFGHPDDAGLSQQWLNYRQPATYQLDYEKSDPCAAGHQASQGIRIV